MKNFLKKILRFQHTYLPLPFFIYKNLFKIKLFHRLFYKYYILCFDTDVNYRKPNTTEFNQSYWLSKRALYWHYAHSHHNRFTKIVNKVFNDFDYLFENKKVCDYMSGIGLYFRDRKYDMMFIEGNKHCCDILKKDYPNSKVINGNWDVIEKYQNDIDTLFVSSGCLVYLNYQDVEKIFKITNKIKNFIFIHEGTDLEDFSFEYSGHNYWNFEKRLKLHNLNYNNSEIFFEKPKNGDVFNYFVYCEKKLK